MLDDSCPFFNVAHIENIAEIITGCNQRMIANKVEEIELKVRNIQLFASIHETLNDDCIMEILSYLDLENIIEFCIFNNRFYMLTQQAYRKLVVNLNATKKMSMFLRAIYFLKALRLGEKIKYLDIIFSSRDSLCCDIELVRVIDEILDTIGDQIIHVNVVAPLTELDREWVRNTSSIGNYPNSVILDSNM